MAAKTNGDEEPLSHILKVCSHSTRRSILTTLVQEGPTRVTDLAERYTMSLNAVSKHIKLLESAGLVSRHKMGRVHMIQANLDPIQEIDRWFQDLRSIWDIRLEELDKVLTKESKMPELLLKVTRTIKAPIEDVYNAWLNPELLARFMIAGEGMRVPRAETDPRVGGRFAIIMANGEQELPHGGVYTTLDPYSQIVFSWESPYSEDGSIVTLNFSPVKQGTLVELVHIKFIDEETRDNHRIGWESILAHLDAVLTQRPITS